MQSLAATEGLWLLLCGAKPSWKVWAESYNLTSIFKKITVVALLRTDHGARMETGGRLVRRLLVAIQVKDEGGWDKGCGSEGIEEAFSVLNIREGRTNRTC